MLSISGQVLSSGVLIEVEIGVSGPREAALRRRGKGVPPRQQATFIVDTGAGITMVNDQLMRQLGLSPTSQTRVMSSTTNGLSEPCDTYDVSLMIVNRSQTGWLQSAMPVLARPLINVSFDGMIGRDVLAHMVLTYEGQHRRFRLGYY